MVSGSSAFLASSFALKQNEARHRAGLRRWVVTWLPVVVVMMVVVAMVPLCLSRVQRSEKYGKTENREQRALECHKVSSPVIRSSELLGPCDHHRASHILGAFPRPTSPSIKKGPPKPRQIPSSPEKP